MSTMIPYRSNRNFTTPYRSILLDDPFFRSFFDMGEYMGSSAFRVDVKDQGDHYTIEAELPGVPQEKIDVTAHEGVLTIRAAREEENKREDARYVYAERRTGHFQRSFNLEGIQEEEISASYQDGILTVRLPKEAPPIKPEPRKIEINASLL